MLRTFAAKISALLRGSQQTPGRFPHLITHSYSQFPDISTRELIDYYECFFDRHDIDGWQIRQGMTELIGMDLVPDPKIIEAAILACRRVNDLALAIRWIEACRDSCGDEVNTVFPYIMQEIRPVMNELGVPTLDELNWLQPELALKSVYE